MWIARLINYTNVPVHIHDHARRTITALRAIHSRECRLNLVITYFFVTYSLNGLDFPPGKIYLFNKKNYQ